MEPVCPGLLTLVYALLLFMLFDLKSRREEVWLAERLTRMGSYQKRSRRLIPFVH